MVEFEWDSHKAAINLLKHNVGFADATTIFDDDNILTILDETSDEERYIAIGLSSLARILLVVYTIRGESLRIISAREATPRERSEYEKTK